jgi:large subunit ribosomal protein L29
MKAKLSALKKELLDLRVQASSGKLDKPHRVQIVRRDAARLLTLLKESSKRSAS